MLKADLIGFHTYDYARHFVSACTRILGLEGTPAGGQRPAHTHTHTLRHRPHSTPRRTLMMSARMRLGFGVVAARDTCGHTPTRTRAHTPCRLQSCGGLSCRAMLSCAPCLTRPCFVPRCRRGGQWQPDARGCLPNWHRPRPLHRGTRNARGQGQHCAAAQQVGVPCAWAPESAWRCVAMVPSTGWAEATASGGAQPAGLLPGRPACASPGPGRPATAHLYASGHRLLPDIKAGHSDMFEVTAR